MCKLTCMLKVKTMAAALNGILGFFGQYVPGAKKNLSFIMVDNKIKLCAHSGSMINLGAEVGVLACTYNGRLAKALRKAMGEQSYEAQISVTPTFSEGQVIEVKGSKSLEGKYILHVIIPNKGYTYGEEFRRKFSTVMQVLLTAASKRSDSLAIPLICPHIGPAKDASVIRKVVNQLICELENFLTNNPDSTLRAVHIVDTDEKVINVILEEFRGISSQKTMPTPPSGMPRSTAAVVREGGAGRAAPVVREGGAGRAAPVVCEGGAGRAAPVVREGWAGRTAAVAREGGAGGAAPVFRQGGACRAAPVAREGGAGWALHVVREGGAGRFGDEFLPEECKPIREPSVIEGWTKHKPLPETPSKNLDLSKIPELVELSTDNFDKCCPICLEVLKKPLSLPCGHLMCKHCFEELEKHKKQCPECNVPFGTVTGTQPEGVMFYRTQPESLPGYEGSGTIEIFYSIFRGNQGKEHPSPGKQFKGIERMAFLPDTAEGRRVLQLLRRAFDRRLIFTIGESRTTGKEGVVTWNDIHHKTRKDGGTERFGYPDPNYLSRVTEELAAKGVTD